jgi:hypothetical protein
MSPRFPQFQQSAGVTLSLVSLCETYLHRGSGCQNLISLLFLDLEKMKLGEPPDYRANPWTNKRGERSQSFFLLHILFMGNNPYLLNKVLETQIGGRKK